MNTVNKLSDKDTSERAMARTDVTDAVVLMLDNITKLEAKIESESYQRGFEDGKAWLQEEFKRVTNKTTQLVRENATITTPYVLSEIDTIMQNSIITYVTEGPLRSIDITNKLLALPLKTPLTEKAIRLAINRLKNTGKIEEKAGRWYVTGAKPATPQYKVMTYLPDGSKYLGTDIMK